MKSKYKNIILIGIGIHLFAISILTFALSYPNPIKAFQTHPLPKAPFEVGKAENTPYWFFRKSNCTATLLIAHGRSHDKSYMTPLIDSIWDQTDLCILAIDLPAHGENPYTTTTIGPREKKGITEALTWLKTHNYTEVFLYGVSMGGSAIIHAFENKTSNTRILGYITDGTYSDLMDLVQQAGDRLFIPRYIQKLSIFLVHLWVGYEVENVHPKNITPKIPYPYLALHGRNDTLAPLDSPHNLTIQQPNSIAMWYEGGHDEPHNRNMQSCVVAFIQSIQQYSSAWKEHIVCQGEKITE